MVITTVYNLITGAVASYCNIDDCYKVNFLTDNALSYKKDFIDVNGLSVRYDWEGVVT